MVPKINNKLYTILDFFCAGDMQYNLYVDTSQCEPGHVRGREEVDSVYDHVCGRVVPKDTHTLTARDFRV